MPAPHLAADAVCALHPRARAVDVCSRCGAFACRACVSSVAGVVHCDACAKKAFVRDASLALDANATVAAAITAALLPPIALAAWGHAARRLRQPGLSERTRSRFRLAQKLALWIGLGSLLAWINVLLRALR